MLSLLEKEHVKDVYDEIADHFSDTRYCIWNFVKNFVEAAALSTGCTVKITSPDYRYSEVLNNKVMYELFIENGKDVGREMLYEDSAIQGLGSTDMGNVSLAMPSIHPMMGHTVWQLQ